MPRPKKREGRKPSRSVTLNAPTIEALTELGNGNLSMGIEMAYQGYIAFRAMQGLPPLVPQTPEAPRSKPTKKVAKK